jgi:transcriptional regulator of met regulon
MVKERKMPSPFIHPYIPNSVPEVMKEMMREIGIDDNS